MPSIVVRRVRGSLLFAGLALSLFDSTLRAQPQPLVDSSITLVNIARAGNADESRAPNVAGWRENIAIRLAGCKNLWQRQQVLKQPLILYINNIPLPSLKAFNPILPDADTGLFYFGLSDNEQTDSLWHHLLPGSVLTKTSGRYRAFITAGLANDKPIFHPGENSSNAQNNFTLILFEKTWTYVFYVLYALLAYGVYLLCRKKELIKTLLPNGAVVFSLSKTQLLLWTMLVVGSFVYIWIITLHLPTIDGSILVLLGISVGTTTVSRQIDGSNAQKPGAANMTVQSKGIIYDILSDDSGISVHRLQNALFTLTLMAVFVSDVVGYLRMPAIDSTLLAVMGISSAGYLTAKPLEGGTGQVNPPPTVGGPPSPPTPPNAPAAAAVTGGSAPLPPE